jgi:heme A synthase
MSGTSLHKWMIALSCCALALAVRDAFVRPEPGWAVVQVCFVQVLFAVLALLTVMTSRGWKAEPACMPDSGWPSLRALAWIAPPAVFLQVMMGAAFRHHILSAVPHVVWALAAALLLLVMGAIVVTTEEVPAQMKRLAVALLCLIVVQVGLGVGAFVARPADGVDAGSSATLMIALHVGNGALLLGVTTALSALSLRNFEPARSRGVRGNLISPGGQS